LIKDALLQSLFFGEKTNEEYEMKVLLISANTLPASPAGPAYVAGAAMRAGHIIEVFECLFAQDLNIELRECIKRYKPDVIGISIRLVHGYVIDETAEFNTRHLDLRSNVKEVVNCVRSVTSAPIILGGPGFNYYAVDWLNYLDLDYGIRGEADISFPLFLERLEQGGDLTTVPGCVFRQNGRILKVPRGQVEDLDKTAIPAYELFDLERYYQLGISPAILTKRGCLFRCTYCPYPYLEGSRYRLKSPGRVVDEIKHLQRLKNPKMLMFCENNFNVPKFHAEAICHEIINRKLEITWGTGDMRPLGVDEEFCHLLKESGCSYINLSVESGSAKMLQSMQRGYTVADIHQSIVSVEKAGIPFGVSLMLGAPGETPETVAESLDLIGSYPNLQDIWITVGICLWTPLQEVLQVARQSGQLQDDRDLFAGATYLSPGLPKNFMLDLIESLRHKKGINLQVNKPYAEFRQITLS
jgi:hypothetical protein